MNDVKMLTFFSETNVVPINHHIVVLFENWTMVSGHFRRNEAAEIVFCPDIHGSKEDELAAEVDPSYIERWFFMPEVI